MITSPKVFIFSTYMLRLQHTTHLLMVFVKHPRGRQGKQQVTMKCPTRKNPWEQPILPTSDRFELFDYLF